MSRLQFPPPGEGALNVLVGIGDELLDAGQEVGHDHLEERSVEDEDYDGDNH